MKYNFSDHRSSRYGATLLAALLTIPIFANPPAIPNVDQLLERSKKSEIPLPTHGQLVVKVAPGSPADRNAIKLGHILMPRNETDAIVFPDTRGEPTHWLNPRGEITTHEHPGGMWGMWQVPYRNIVYWYLHYGQRNHVWDKDVITALYSQSTDMKSVHQHWKKAIDQGYKEDTLFHWSMACVTASAGEKDRFGQHLSKVGPIKPPSKPKDFPHSVDDWTRMTLLLGDIDLLKKASSGFENVPSDLHPKAIDAMHLQAKKFPLPVLSPAAQADQMERISYLADATFPSYNIEPLHRLAASVGDSPPYQFKPYFLSVEAEKFASISLLPPAPVENIDVRLEFQFTKETILSKEQGKFQPGVFFGLWEAMKNPDADKAPDSKPYLTRRIATIDFSAQALQQGHACSIQSMFTIYNPKASYAAVSSDSIGINQFYPFPYTKLSADEYTTLRVVKVGMWVELLIDGKRVALFPSHEAVSNPFLYLKIVGCQVRIRSLRGDLLQ